MDKSSQNLIAANLHRLKDTIYTGREDGEEDDGGGGGGGQDDCRDIEAWETLSASFKEVQKVLDRNRQLIEQVNENHQSMIPRNIARNVELIREINENISRVVGLYSTLSADFTGLIHRRRGEASKDL